MVGDWGEPVDKEELDNNIKEDILIGLFCQEDVFCPTDILFQPFFYPKTFLSKLLPLPRDIIVPLSL